MNAPVQALWVVNREEAADSQSWGSKFLSTCLSSTHCLIYKLRLAKPPCTNFLPLEVIEDCLFTHSFILQYLPNMK